MSQTPTSNNGPGTGLMNRPGRQRASVTLRQQGQATTQTMSDLMDPANRSLADALKIAFRLLQGSIVLMVGLYVASGYQQVEEGQRGVRLMLGKIDQENIPPGPNWSAPAPIGDMLRVNTGVQSLDIKEAFFPRLSADEEKMLADPKMRENSLGGGANSLDPDYDGVLLTGDGSIVHARWRVTYKRTDDGRSLRNIAQEPPASDAMDQRSIEERLVAAAVQRGIVHAASKMTIDQVLAGLAREPAREEANRMLQALDAGIAIQSVDMTDKMPPRQVIKNFNDVQAAQAEAAKAVEEARGDARQMLAETAGEAAPALLAKIDTYEKQLATKDAGAEATLAAIHDVMMRRASTSGGTPLDVTLSGRVARVVGEAEQYRTSVATRAESDAGVFEAKRQAFKANPSVFLSNEWTDAVGSFMRRDTVQALALPANLSRTVLMINRDPELQKALEQERLERIGEEARQKRAREAERARFEASKNSE
ncbi:MAG: hypothetical protein K2Q20_07335 [Phycisphaerales bacterium]|nr:hypothetical protein [Phycisphaerales bacterium]